VEFLDATGAKVVESEPFPAMPVHVTHRGTRVAVSLIDGRVLALEGARTLGSSSVTGTPMGPPVLSPDRSVIYAAEPSGAVWAWSFPSMEVRHRLVSLPEGDVAIAVSPEGQLLAAGGANGRVNLWGAASGTLIATWHAHDTGVAAIAFGPKLWLGTAGLDGELRSWRMAALGWDATQAREQADDKLRFGRIAPLEYRDSVNQLSQARNQQNQASFDLLAAYYQVRYATGIDAK
jgi:WD40 repeat protein